MKIFIIYLILFCSVINAREIGQTEITTEEGIEVYQKEKFYLLKKNVEIESDNFKLTAEKVKAHFDKDLYDITNIFCETNVVFESSQGLKVTGNVVEHDIKKEIMKVNGKNSNVINKDFTMISDGSIKINNLLGNFELYGPNSKLNATDIIIIGEDIKGNFINVNGENIVNKLNVIDKDRVNIQTETSNMFAKRAEYNKQQNIIELFENVVIIRNNESISGDYAKMNTLDESYFVKSNTKSKRVKAILENTDE